MRALVLVEVILAAIVACADSAGGGSQRPPLRRLARAVFWMATVSRWLSDRDAARLARFGTIVWFLVTTGWLLTLLYDRTPLPVFVVAGEALMAFVVYTVDASSPALFHHPLRRTVRALLWPPVVVGYMRAPDSGGIAHASLTVWILLTTGWLLSLAGDRILGPLGLAGS